MNEMRMRVAKVICERLFGPFDPSELDRPSSVSAQSMMAAIGVIEVMRDPTAEMKQAGDDEIPDHIGYADDASLRLSIDDRRGAEVADPTNSI